MNVCRIHGGHYPERIFLLQKKVSVIKFISEMNVCIVHGGHGKERIYLLQKKYHIYISESHYPSEKLARDISVGEKISTIIIQNDGMFA